MEGVHSSPLAYLVASFRSTDANRAGLLQYFLQLRSETLPYLLGHIQFRQFPDDLRDGPSQQNARTEGELSASLIMESFLALAATIAFPDFPPLSAFLHTSVSLAAILPEASF
jgi:hypothetical protein